MAEKKMTKREMFSTIKEMLKDNADVVAFCDHEIELLSKKSSKSGSLSKAQRENLVLMEQVYEALVKADRPMAPLECVTTFAIKGIASTQKMTPLLKNLVKEDRVVKSEVDGKALYMAVKVEEAETEAE